MPNPPIIHCNHCKHEWSPRVKIVQRCPECNSGHLILKGEIGQSLWMSSCTPEETSMLKAVLGAYREDYFDARKRLNGMAEAFRCEWAKPAPAETASGMRGKANDETQA